MRFEKKSSGMNPRFSAVEAGREVGECNYYIENDRIFITHVGVEPEYRGTGVAKQLVMTVAGYARENDMKITPVCSYARAIFDRYPQLEDVWYGHGLLEMG